MGCSPNSDFGVAPTASEPNPYALYISDEVYATIRLVFLEIDFNKDNIISLPDLTQLLQKMKISYSLDLLTQLLDILNVDKSVDSVTFMRIFIALYVAREVYLANKKLGESMAYFALLDTNYDQIVSISDLTSVLKVRFISQLLDQKQIQEIVFNITRNESLDMAQFCELYSVLDQKLSSESNQ